MNGRKVKILRKRAEQENIGTAKEYQFHKKSIYEIDGKKYCNTMELKNCTRKAYRKLKQEVKK
jgi:hypothetical protein